MKNSALKQRALRGVTWAAIGGNGAQILAFVFFVLISRVVGPEAFGAVAISLLLIETARVFCSECVAVNLITTGVFRKEAFNAGFVLSFGMALLITVILSLLAGPLAALFHVAALSTVLPQLAPVLLLLSVSRLFEAELMLRMEFRPLAIRSLGAACIGGGAGVIAAHLNQGVEALVLQQWMAALTAIILLGAQAHWRPGRSFDRQDLILLARQSAALSPANLITNIRQSFDGLAIGAFSGAATAGVYNFAKRVRLALQLGLSTAITRVSLPTFAHVRQNQAHLASTLNQALGLAALVAYPVFIGVGAIAPELIQAFLGEQWAAAALPLTLLMIGGAVSITTRLSENALLVCERRRIIIAINGGALALLMLAVVLTGRFGPGAIAAAVSTEGVLHEFAAWAFAARVIPELKLREYLVRVWKPMAICIAMLLLIALLRQVGVAAHNTALRMTLFVMIGAAFYGGAVWILARPAALAAIEAGRVILPAGWQDSRAFTAPAAMLSRFRTLWGRFTG